MKKTLLLIAALFFCLSSFAEPGSRKEERKAQKDSIRAAEMVGAHHKGVKIKLDGTVLTKEQQALLLSNIDLEDYNDEWASYRKQRHLGNGLAIGGSVMIGAGAVAEGVAIVYVLAGVLGAAFTLGQGDVQPIFDIAGYWAVGGLAAAGVGAGALAVGIPIRVKADKKMKGVCDGYNNATERVEKELIFGSTGSGVGLAWRF